MPGERHSHSHSRIYSYSSLIISGTFVIHFFGLLACLLHSNDNYDVNAFVVGCAFGGSYLFVSGVSGKCLLSFLSSHINILLHVVTV